MTAAPEPTVDVAEFFKLTGRAGQGILGLFLLTQWVLTGSTIDMVLVPWMSIAALLLVTAAAVIAMRPGTFPLSMRRTTALLCITTASTAMVTCNLPIHGWPGYASWHLGANAFVLVAVGLRGRIWQSWVGMAVMAAICVIWAVSTGQGVIAGVQLIDRQAGALLIGTMFAVGLRPTARAIAQFHDADRRRAAQEADTEAGERERQRQSARLRTDVEPVLRLIATANLTNAERDRLRVVEASLRDEIRAGSLLHEPLTSSVQQARERGIDVLLLDDSGGALPAEPTHRDAIAWMAGAVDSIERGRVVIRLPPPRDKRVASIHIDDDQRSRAIEFPRQA